MRVMRFIQKGEYRIIDRIEAPVVDPVATEKAILEQLPGGTSDAQLNQPILGVPVFCNPGPGAIFIEDIAAAPLEAQLASLAEHQLLLDTGEILPQWEGTRYYIKREGQWKEETMSEVGLALPEGAVLPEELSAEQNAEIVSQSEAARIAAMPEGQRAEEKQQKLDSLADETARLEKRNQIQGLPFDPIAWYQEKAAGITALYA